MVTELENAETMQFQAETRQLLDLMIHSIYSNKEIFLRELISNSSDALDKLRLVSLTDQSYLMPENPAIRIEANKEKRLLTITDNGIGMSREEVVQNIGTIAKSGTKELLEKLKASGQNVSAELIGQFGVGFYSAFMVAAKITMITRKANETISTTWESTGDGTYKIGMGDKESAGTTIILELKPADQENSLDDFTEDYTLERIIKKYSDFINYPVILKVEKEEGDEKDDKKKKKIIEDKTVNSMKPIWTRQRSDVKDEEYHEFYKHISHDFTDPLKIIPYRAEGRIEYQSLLFLPARAPFDFYYQNFQSGLQLYVKRVMIMEAMDDLLPHYLRFVKGVVETSDLPLNISREILQKDKHIALIKKGLTGKILSTLKEILEKENETYLKFWKEFGPAIKEGAHSDYENKDKLKDLLLFNSSNSEDKLTTLKEYKERMHPEQKEIYFIAGESRQLLENSPHAEAVRNKGYEILYLLEGVDELLLQNLHDYEGKPFKAIGKGELNLGDEKEKEKTEKDLKKKEKDFERFLNAIKEKLSEHVKEVKLSANLISAPACLKGDEFDMSPFLEKILSRNGEKPPKPKKILELNPEHALIRKLWEKFETDSAGEKLEEYAHLLFGYACIADGADLPDAVGFNKTLTLLMSEALK